MPTASASKEYGYDALGQLTTETTGASTRTYAYDTAGNIRSITKDGTVTKSFGYTNPSWPDLLTSVTANGTTKDVLYEGQSQTSDLPSSGNPITYYNGKDYTFTWTKGRQLASATVDGQTVKYAYDMSGVRSGKQVGDTTYTYTTLSGKVMRQQWDGKTLEFVYDDSSQPFAMIYKHGSETELYYYFVSAQGDVSAILDSGGKIAASYDYDAWGNCTVYNSSDAAIGDLNPLRYRGYYYDAETGFYYLQSRYYDFANCRFINADAYVTTNVGSILNSNMFAYCENNPILFSDQHGNYRFIDGYTPPQNTKNSVSIPIPEPFSVGYFNQFGNEYANGLYVKATPPNLDRGLTIVNAEAGIMSIGGDYRFGSWSLTTVSAKAKAGASLDYIGFCADAALIRGEAGVRIKLPFTKKKLFLGAGADAISFGIRAYYDSERGRVEIGLSDVIGVSIIIGLEGNEK